MALRFKLLFVALATLALPWVGWQFVAQTERLLRGGQEQALLASADTLARALGALGAELPASGVVLYVHRAATPIRIDGYADDWTDLLPDAQALGPAGDEGKLRVVLAADARWIYLLALARDATRARADATDPAVARADHLELNLQRGSERRRYRLASAAPGSFEAVADRTAVDAAELPDRIAGEWQEDGSGYRVELRLPRALAPDRLGIEIHDAQAPVAPAGEVHPLMTYDSVGAQLLARLVPAHVRARLVSADAWLLAAAGSFDLAHDADGGGIDALVYRRLIAPSLTGSAVLDATPSRLDAAEVWQALSGVPATSWRSAGPQGSGPIVLTAVVPVREHGEVRGALVLEQASRALPLLANRALLTLAAASLLALGIAAALLLLFGGLLSLRIGRLRDAAERAVRGGGRLPGPLPLADAPDELGDLARSFGKLLDEVGAYTDYLNTLASKLSHELNTPLAIVKSSLDNLDHHPLPPGARAYLLRARDGADRLGTIVRAMSEASRVERAIGAAEAEDFDLRALVAGCAEGYRALAGARDLRLLAPDAPLPFHGAPDLIAQALDKLFDNARSFTPEGGWIALELEALADGGAIVRMANSGPPLPAAMGERLFDTLVSVRERSARGGGEAPHLGLGLYVVRLVAELHHGHAHARNRHDGVEFALELHGMPRRRLTERAPEG